MKLTKNITKYLNNKLRGGEVNERGNKYEAYFTTYKIAESINLYPTKTDLIFISSQEYAFVDDLLIINNGNRTLFQLKSSKKLKWGLARKLKTLNFDFSIQRRIEIFHKRNFRLCLVVANNTLQNNLIKVLPLQLKSCTNIVLFKYNDTIQKQIINDPFFRSELEKLIAFKSPTVDKLESLASTILGVWNATNKKNIILEDIYLKLEQIGYSFIKPRVIVDINIATKAVLDLIPDFIYVCNNNYLTWSYKTFDKGVIPYQIGSVEFVNIEREIQGIAPKNFLTLEKIIA